MPAGKKDGGNGDIEIDDMAGLMLKFRGEEIMNDSPTQPGSLLLTSEPKLLF